MIKAFINGLLFICGLGLIIMVVDLLGMSMMLIVDFLQDEFMNKKKKIYRRRKMTKIKDFIRTTWELPQHIVGFIIKKVCKATPYTTYKDANVYTWNIGGGISLGRYIFVPYKNADPDSYQVQQFIKHEYGHTVQSKYLGWLYLLVIGLPSLIWAQCFRWYWSQEGKSYYDFYTEKWANKLGCVE